MKPLRRNDLDQLLAGGCSNPDCKHKDHKLDDVFLIPRCHPDDAVEVSYHGDSGCITVKCSICEKEIAVIQVASEDKMISTSPTITVSA